MFGLSGKQKGDAAAPTPMADRIARRAIEMPVASASASAVDTSVLPASFVETAAARLAAESQAGRNAGEVARVAAELVQAHFAGQGAKPSPLVLRNHVSALLASAAGAAAAPLPQAPAPKAPATGFPANPTTAAEARVSPEASPVAPSPENARLAPHVTKAPEPAAGAANRGRIDQAKKVVQPKLLQRMDIAAASELPKHELQRQLEELVHELLHEAKIQLNRAEANDLVAQMMWDMLGLGPLEPLLADDAVTDIMVNGPKQIYVERRGKLELTGVTFEDNAHVLNICNRIVSRIGRRVDEASPIADARLLDGSRVNIIIPPLAIDGPSISIRKFPKGAIDFDRMSKQGNMSPQMSTVLKIAARCRANVIISGGTGSGKTTLLNALFGMVDHGERVVTIEDAAELRLQQPHVVRLETRPPNLEGRGEINMRDLVKNALRMRPDRIILGEVRGGEAVDLLQAMNTGHDGSMGTLHANRPREALSRLENMMSQANLNLPNKAMRQQIAGALHLIIQIQRMRDGMRRVTHITEVIGMEGEVITTQDLFLYEFKGERPDGKLDGVFKSTGLRPHFLPKAAYYGLDKVLLEAMG